ncbi:YciI family protein, partial [Mycobacteroides abscessus subsp. massiliense]
MLSIVYAPGAVQPDEAALETIGADVQAVTRRMQDAGVWLFAAGLQPADTATMVTASAAGHTTTDGPYTETKEQLGGFSIIDVPTLADAQRWAAEVSRA